MKSFVFQQQKNEADDIGALVLLGHSKLSRNHCSNSLMENMIIEITRISHKTNKYRRRMRGPHLEHGFYKILAR
jgi:hypothetical protein